MIGHPELPVQYELIVCNGNAIDEAMRLAATGAEEGTLVWVQPDDPAAFTAPDRLRERRVNGHARLRPTEAFGGPGGSDSLSVALVLRPEEPLDAAMQLLYLAKVSLGAFLAGALPPFSAPRYRWPGEVMLGGDRLAGVKMVCGPVRDERCEWLVLGVEVDIAALVEALAGTSSRADDSPDREDAAADVLTGFGRQFLAWIERWLDEGFAPVRKAWLLHADGVGERVVAETPHGQIGGRLLDLTDAGELVLSLDDGSERRVGSRELVAGRGVIGAGVR